MFCSTCGSQIGENSAYCPSCGNALQQAQTQSRPTKYCQNCGSQIDLNAELCPKCGVRVQGFVQAPQMQYSGTQVGAMKYCQKCGAVNDPSQTYCKECGEVSFASSPPSKIARPTGVTILAALQILIALVDIAIGLFFGALLSFILPGLGLLVAAISFLPLIFGIALLTGRNWARLLAMVGAIFDLFGFPLGTIFGIAILWYLTRPRVKAYFKQPK